MRLLIESKKDIAWLLSDGINVLPSGCEIVTENPVCNK